MLTALLNYKGQSKLQHAGDSSQSSDSSTGPLQPKDTRCQAEFQYGQSDECRAELQRVNTGPSLAWGHRSKALAKLH